MAYKIITTGNYILRNPIIEKEIINHEAIDSLKSMAYNTYNRFEVIYVYTTDIQLINRLRPYIELSKGGESIGEKEIPKEIRVLEGYKHIEYDLNGVYVKRYNDFRFVHQCLVTEENGVEYLEAVPTPDMGIGYIDQKQDPISFIDNMEPIKYSKIHFLCKYDYYNKVYSEGCDPNVVGERIKAQFFIKYDPERFPIVYFKHKTMEEIAADSIQTSKKKIINKDYIGVIKERNGVLCYCEVVIPQEDVLITEIDAMKKNDNRTLMDVQQRFVRSYPPECVKADGYSIGAPDGYYNYLYPSSYNSAYVNGAGYPKLLTYDEYKKALIEKESYLRNKYFMSEETQNSLALLRKYSESNYQKKIAELEKIIVEEVKEYKNNLRTGFNYKPFIYAHNYKLKLWELLQEDDVRMYSTDQIGWKEFEYKVNDDITIYMKTNFGYGSASYFFCNLKYKGINILPYSAVVEYYHVQWTDLVRFTRQYEEDRDSWRKVFDFVVETANLAKIAPEQFIKKWILNELDEMLRGLKTIVACPKKVVEDYIKEQKNTIEIGYYKLVRNCSTRDIQEYEIFPNEKIMAIKAEKITGCLLLLDNLRRLEDLSPIVNDYIKDIKGMNRNILPEIKTSIIHLENNISRLEKNLNQVLMELNNIKIIIAKHNKMIKTLEETMNSGRNDGKKYSIDEVMKTYLKKNPDYQKDLNQKVDIEERKEIIDDHIRLRNKFLNIMKKCKERVSECLKVA